MMDPWMDVCSLVMVFPMNGSSVAEHLLHSIIAKRNMFYDGTMDGCVRFGYDICYEWV